MKSSALLVSAVLFATASSGQWLEQVLELGEDEYPWKVCYNPVSDKVYVANQCRNNVVILDGATNQVITRVPVGQDPQALCFSSTENKVYCAYTTGVLAIDGVSNRATARISVGSPNLTLWAHPLLDKVYADGGDSTVAVIDGAADSVVGLVRAGHETRWMLHEAGHDRLYCTGWYGDHKLTVVDCATDRVATVIRPGRYPGEIAWSPVAGRVCVACDDQLVSIDCSSFQVDTLYSGSASLVSTVPGRGKLYFRAGPIRVYDLLGDTLAGELPIPLAPYDAIVYDSTHGRMYFAEGWYAHAVDCGADTVVATIGLGQYSRFKSGVWNSRHDRVYLADYVNRAIFVIRDTTAVGVGEEQRPSPAMDRLSRTVFRDLELARLDCQVIDALGRDVTDRRDRLAPGVYFLHSSLGIGHSSLVTRKVIVQR